MGKRRISKGKKAAGKAKVVEEILENEQNFSAEEESATNGNVERFDSESEDEQPVAAKVAKKTPVKKGKSKSKAKKITTSETKKKRDNEEDDDEDVAREEEGSSADESARNGKMDESESEDEKPLIEKDKKVTPKTKPKKAPAKGKAKGRKNVEVKKKEESDDDDSEKEYEVETILDYRKRKGKDQYQVKWKGFPRSEATWEPEEHLECPEKLKAFQDKHEKENLSRRHRISTSRSSLAVKDFKTQNKLNRVQEGRIIKKSKKDSTKLQVNGLGLEASSEINSFRKQFSILRPATALTFVASAAAAGIFLNSTQFNFHNLPWREFESQAEQLFQSLQTNIQNFLNLS